MTDTGRTQPLPTEDGATTGPGSTRLHDDLSVDRSSVHGGPDDVSIDRSGAQHDPTDLRAAARGTDASERRVSDPVEAAQRPDNRAKLLLATAAMTLLNLLLLLGILASMAGPDFERVAVDGQQCVIELGEGEDSTLYCQP